MPHVKYALSVVEIAKERKANARGHPSKIYFPPHPLQWYKEECFFLSEPNIPKVT